MDALLSQLISEARSASALVLWLDCDREGENIAAEARDACLQANSHLTVFRARFRCSAVLLTCTCSAALTRIQSSLVYCSALTQADVENAMNRLARGINEFDVKAVDVRQEVDLRVGAAFTRFQTLLLGERWSVTSSVLSFGPCQFPTLGFIVQRWWEHQAHTPEDFWRIKLEHTFATCYLLVPPHTLCTPSALSSSPLYPLLQASWMSRNSIL
jgi:DNA topoisomerase-3